MFGAGGNCSRRPGPAPRRGPSGNLIVVWGILEDMTERPEEDPGPLPTGAPLQECSGKVLPPEFNAPVQTSTRRGRVGRRVVLTATGSLAVAGLTGKLIAEDVLPGRVRLSALLGLNGPSGKVPDAPTGSLRGGSFVSAARGGVRTGWLIAYPPGVDPDRGSTAADSPRLAVCVLLHGRGGDERSLTELGFDRFLADGVRRGVPPFAIAAVAGGDRYWHARRAGDDSGRMVIEEFLPLLARRGLAARPTDRVAMAGWSMGGYGALLLAETLGPARVAAVSVISPALWLHPADSAPGAFDDTADYQAHNVFTRQARLRDIGLRVDCGRGDPFQDAVHSFVSGILPAPAGGFQAGGHTDGYFRRMAPELVRFTGTALSRTRTP